MSSLLMFKHIFILISFFFLQKKWVLGATTAVGATAAIMAHIAKNKLTEAIKQQTTIVERLRDLQGLLKKIELGGKQYSKYDDDMFSKHSEDIISVFEEFNNVLENFNDFFKKL